MSTDQQRSRGYRNLLILLTVLAIGYAWYDARHDDATPFSSSTDADPLVHRSTDWAPPGKARVTPGIQTLTGNAQCTTNFVFTDAHGTVYVGEAAHCAKTGGGLNGCKARSRPIGTPVQFARLSSGTVLLRGTLVYSSWLTMQRRHERDPAACAYNDLALIRLGSRAHEFVNPTMPYWGGPNALTGVGLVGGERLYGVGRSSLRKSGSPWAHQNGVALTDKADYAGWSHFFSAMSPGIPGDSGSGYLDSSGRAIGTLSTLFLSRPMVNGLGDLRHELAYARRWSGIEGLRLELGTAPFNINRALAATRTTAPAS